MSLRDNRSHAFDLVAAADVAQLVFCVELLRECPQAVLATRDQDRVPAACGQRAGDRCADSAGRARDDGYAVVLYRQTLTSRVAERFLPAVSAASALSACRPAGTSRVPQEPVYTPSAPRRSTSICFPSTKKRTERMGFVELATTMSPAVLDTH
jgi:hypothetical protein